MLTLNDAILGTYSGGKNHSVTSAISKSLLTRFEQPLLPSSSGCAATGLRTEMGKNFLIL